MTKVAIITGAGRGIGAACAVKFAKLGYNIVVNYRNDEISAKDVVNQVTALGRNAIAVKADVSDVSAVHRMFELADALGNLSVLVNNAGVLEKQSAFVDMSLDRIRRIFETNVMGVMICSQVAVRKMSTQNSGCGGVIINVSSGASQTGSPFEYVDYAASKGAIDSFTVGLAVEVAQQGIRVNGVRPGLIYTDMHSSGGEPNRVDRLKHNLPLGRGGLPEEVAAAIAFLASDDSAYTTGSFLNVTGGR